MPRSERAVEPLPIDIHDRPDFDRSSSRVWNASGPVDGAVERFDLDHELASEKLRRRPRGWQGRGRAVGVGASGKAEFTITLTAAF